MNFYWLSFTDQQRPVGEQFLGVVLVDAPSLADALTQAHDAGCNPGGEVASLEVPHDELDALAFHDAEVRATVTLPRLTLLSLEALRARDVPVISGAEHNRLAADGVSPVGTVKVTRL